MPDLGAETPPARSVKACRRKGGQAVVERATFLRSGRRKKKNGSVLATVLSCESAFLSSAAPLRAKASWRRRIRGQRRHFTHWHQQTIHVPQHAARRDPRCDCRAQESARVRQPLAGRRIEVRLGCLRE